MRKALRFLGRPFDKYVRRRPTLPPRYQGSTIGAEGLSFRVRNGTGRFPFAIMPPKLYGVVAGDYRLRRKDEADNQTYRSSGAAQWTREYFVVKPSAY
jgi:hypothetical protein